MECDVVALRAFPMPVELQKRREVCHGREKAHAGRERAKNMIKTDDVQKKEKMNPGIGLFS